MGVALHNPPKSIDFKVSEIRQSTLSIQQVCPFRVEPDVCRSIRASFYGSDESSQMCSKRAR